MASEPLPTKRGRGRPRSFTADVPSSSSISTVPGRQLRSRTAKLVTPSPADQDVPSSPPRSGRSTRSWRADTSGQTPAVSNQGLEDVDEDEEASEASREDEEVEESEDALEDEEEDAPDGTNHEHSEMSIDSNGQDEEDVEMTDPTDDQEKTFVGSSVSPSKQVLEAAPKDLATGIRSLERYTTKLFECFTTNHKDDPKNFEDVLTEYIEDSEKEDSLTAGRRRRFDASFSPYRADNSSFSSIEAVLEHLAGGPAGLDLEEYLLPLTYFLQQANLAFFVDSMITSVPGGSDVLRILEAFDLSFPQNFLLSDSEREFDKAFELALSIRTQHFLALLQHTRMSKASFDTKGELQRIFFDKQFRGQADSQTIPSNGQRSQSNAVDVLSLTTGRQDDILDCDDEQDELDLAKLLEKFPWKQFLYDLFEWTAGFAQQSNAVIKSRGGSKRAHFAMGQLLDRGSNQVIQSIEGGANDARGPQKLAKYQRSSKSSRSADKPSKNLYNQSQENATQVSAFDDDQEMLKTPEPSQPRRQHKNSSREQHGEDNEKGTAEEDDDDNDDPDDSTQEPLAKNTAATRRREPSFPPKSKSESKTKTKSKPIPKRVIPTNERARSPSLSQKSPKDGIPGPKFVQKRSKWTIEAERALANAIERYDCYWAAIRDNAKKGDPLYGKTNVDLKDKARNMKFAMLKAGETLPGNFDNVLLAARHKQKLTELGIDWQVPGEKWSPERGLRQENEDEVEDEGGDGNE